MHVHHKTSFYGTMSSFKHSLTFHITICSKKPNISGSKTVFSMFLILEAAQIPLPYYVFLILFKKICLAGCGEVGNSTVQISLQYYVTQESKCYAIKHDSFGFLVA